MVNADDAAFIAAARTDVPALVAAVRAVLGRHTTDADGVWCGDCRWGWPCPTVRAVTDALGGERA